MFMENKLRALMKKNQLDAYFIAKKVNVRYITSYKGDDAFVFITQTNQYIITDPRYTEQVAIEAPDYTVINWRQAGKTLGDALSQLAKDNQVTTIGFEADQLTYQTYQDLKDKVEADFIPAPGIIEKMRRIKTPEEQEKLKRACDISCRAFERILGDIRVGITEKELAARLALYMVEEGADTQPYGNILISGAKTSLLHGIPSEKAIEYGDFVLMDFGCQYDGYLSDMTRTVVVGQPTDKQLEVYELEKQMLERSLEYIKPGVKTKEVYHQSLKPIENTEYLPYHYGNIGHCIGLFIHEQPMMSDAYEDVFEPGMVTTIEPGLYIPGWGGVRIEDQVIVTEQGYENLIWIPHDLIQL
ncbi:aminopeptidase P family protein [Vagococcus humatus]|uniref:Aminopeptidase P family protein n=2 Tax=Vagococcus humatus TaxID=1889241 RepID=A0A3R9ZX89_9ENTE|nr:aminopeptidase P family protein [Vagococcus humatus]